MFVNFNLLINLFILKSIKINKIFKSVIQPKILFCLKK